MLRSCLHTSDGCRVHSGIGLEIATELCRRGATGAGAAPAPVLRAADAAEPPRTCSGPGLSQPREGQAAAVQTGRGGSSSRGGPAQTAHLLQAPLAERLRLQVALLDVSSLKSVRSFAQAWGERPLHLLINNAGIFDIGGGPSPFLSCLGCS